MDKFSCSYPARKWRFSCCKYYRVFSGRFTLLLQVEAFEQRTTTLNIRSDYQTPRSDSSINRTIESANNKTNKTIWMRQV